MYTSTTFANRTTVARSLKKIHVARIIVLVLFLSPVWVSAQVLTPVELPENGVTEAPLYEDEHGNRYSTLVVVRFDELVFDSTRGQEVVSLANDLVNGKQTLGTALGNLDLTYGSYIIRKIVPNAVWGDTLRTHVRTGAPVVISDYSQLFAFWFDDPVPLAQIRSEIELIQEVEYTEEPQIIILESTWMPFDNPNDPLYNEQWYLYTLKAEQSWGITRGIGPNGSLGIAFADVFSCQLSGAQMHPDLINKLNVLNCGNYLSSPNHGYNVAGMSGAETDNGIFLASLGRDVNLYGFHGLSNALALTGC